MKTFNADGSVEFTCTSCDADVVSAIDDGFESPVCMACRFFQAHPEWKPAIAGSQSMQILVWQMNESARVITEVARDLCGRGEIDLAAKLDVEAEAMKNLAAAEAQWKAGR